MPLGKEVVHIPLAYGLQSKADPRALTAPALSIARDVQFDELGGIQPRLPFEGWPMDIRGGGTLADLRRLAVVRDELLAFTSTALYAWSEGDAAWVLRGTHLAVSVEEEALYARIEEQVGADRAELGGVVFSCWTNVLGATTAAHNVMVAARDADTGAVILPPTAMGAGTTQPKLIALSARVLLFYEDAAGDLRAHTIDPTTIVVTAGAGTQVAAAAVFNRMYDVCQSTQNPDNALLVFRRDTTTSYSIVRIPQTLSGMSTTTKARPSDEAMAVASSPAVSNRCVVVRRDGTNIEADLLNESTFADVTIDAALGTVAVASMDQVAAAFRTVQDGGQFRCYVFWTQNEPTTSAFNNRSNFINTAGAVGSMGTFVQTTGIASRAFEHGGNVYVWVAFAQASDAADNDRFFSAQNSYFLFRHDGLLVAKAASLRGGGHQQLVGRLPGVQSLGDGRFAWAGEQRRIVPIGSGRSSDYSARIPLEVTFAFDDDRARRCVRLGETLYITGGQIIQYDGEGVAEVGFHAMPYRLTLVPGASGNFSAGLLAWRQLHRWDNARGERERSSCATTETELVSAGEDASLVAEPFNLTLKFGATSHIPQGVRSPVVEEFYRTVANAPPGAPMFMVTSRDPAVSTGDNAFVVSNFVGTASVTDALSDDDLRAREPFPENGGELPNLPPPPATIIEATQDRIILSGIADRPNAVRYSKLRRDGEIASFNDILRFELPPTGGRNTAVAFLNETLVVFQETAIFAVPGDGFGNVLGVGSNYGPGRLISSDIGAESQDAVAFTPKGLLFKSRKGWYSMADWGPPRYVGDKVSAFDTEAVRSVQVVESQHHVRILTAGRMLIWDYEADQWAEWPIADLAHGVVWRGQHMVIAGGEVQAQAAAHGSTVQLDAQTGWVATGGIQGFQRVWWVMVLGELLSACRLRLRLAIDYDEDNYIDDKIWTPSPGVNGRMFQVRHGPSRQQCQALRVRVTALHSSLDQAPVGGGVNLTAISLECGVQPGLFRSLPAAQRQ